MSKKLCVWKKISSKSHPQVKFIISEDTMALKDAH